jgi:hypothetical protein
MGESIADYPTLRPIMAMTATLRMDLQDSIQLNVTHGDALRRPAIQAVPKVSDWPCKTAIRRFDSGRRLSTATT